MGTAQIPYFTNEETKAQSGEMITLRVHHQSLAALRKAQSPNDPHIPFTKTRAAEKTKKLKFTYT